MQRKLSTASIRSISTNNQTFPLFWSFKGAQQKAKPKYLPVRSERSTSIRSKLTWRPPRRAKAREEGSYLVRERGMSSIRLGSGAVGLITNCRPCLAFSEGDGARGTGTQAKIGIEVMLNCHLRILWEVKDLPRVGPCHWFSRVT